MANDPSKLSRRAENRERRLSDRARPSFGLTADEIKRSTDTAMRLAETMPQHVKSEDSEASRPHVE